MVFKEAFARLAPMISGTPNENIVQNHLNIAFFSIQTVDI